MGSKVIMYGGLTIIRGSAMSDVWTLDLSDIVLSGLINNIFSLVLIYVTEYVAPPPIEKPTSYLAVAIAVPIAAVILLSISIGIFFLVRKRRAMYRNKIQNGVVAMDTIVHRPTLSKHGKTLEGVEIKELIGIGNFGTFSGYFRW